MRRLDGKIALITGGRSGIGRAIAEVYEAEGATVVTTARSAGLDRLADAPAGATLIALKADVTETEKVREVVADMAGRFGRIDILVNNAAVQLHGLDGPCHLVDLATWDQTLNVNLRGTFMVCHEVLPIMMMQGTGVVINVSSPTALTRRGAGFTAYASSKGGLMTLTRVLAADYGRYGIRVNTLVPGPTRTPLIQPLLTRVKEGSRPGDNSLLGRIGEAEDQCGIAVFLGSDESAYATGAAFFVDGGVSF
jgi:NAD(P)-dependent dehydrogenase (short-subunit alcohol dehydrogenase family)